MNTTMTGSVVCVLGCRPDAAAFTRRARAARDAYHARSASLVVACGGRSWSGRVEADELTRILVDGGVPEDAILQERESLDTHDNARFAARILTPMGVREVLVVTCSWHLPRATMLFEANGLRAAGLGVEPEGATLFSRVWWPVRERVSTWKDRLRLARRVPPPPRAR